MEKYDKKLTNDETKVADQVANEILTVYEEKDDKRYFFLILFLLLCLIFLVSSLSFAVFDTYYNGSTDNVIDVQIDVDEDKPGKPDKDEDKDEDEDKDKEDDNEGDSSEKPDKDEGKDEDKDEEDETPSIVPGSVLFSFNEGSNYISMNNVLPTSDEVGMNLNGDKEFFDFNISAKIKGNKKGSLVYEVAIVPVAGNTIDENDVRVYLTENSKGVSLDDDEVNTFSELPDSKFYTNAKVIYRKTVSDKFNGNYIFRMWLSSKAEVEKVSKKFACKIVVDAYYK